MYMLYEGGIDRDDEIAGVDRHQADDRAVDMRSPRIRASCSRRSTTRFYGGAMPAGVKAAIYDALLQIESPAERARTAIFLATTAFHFQVSR